MARQHRMGFTIIELLVVVSIIAILTTVIIVFYRGVNARAVEAAARSEMNSFAKRMEMFKAETGRYPAISFVSDSSASAMTEMESILRQTGLYESTRSYIEPETGQYNSTKSFILCASPDMSKFVLIYNKPVTSGLNSARLADYVGIRLLYYSFTTASYGETTFQYTTGIQDTGLNLCKSVLPDYNYTTWPRRWSFDIPTAKAQ